MIYQAWSSINNLHILTSFTSACLFGSLFWRRRWDEGASWAFDFLNWGSIPTPFIDRHKLRVTPPLLGSFFADSLRWNIAAEWSPGSFEQWNFQGQACQAVLSRRIKTLQSSAPLTMAVRTQATSPDSGAAYTQFPFEWPPKWGSKTEP